MWWRNIIFPSFPFFFSFLPIICVVRVCVKSQIYIIQFWFIWRRRRRNHQQKNEGKEIFLAQKKIYIIISIIQNVILAHISAYIIFICFIYKRWNISLFTFSFHRFTLEECIIFFLIWRRGLECARSACVLSSCRCMLLLRLVGGFMFLNLYFFCFWFC